MYMVNCLAAGFKRVSDIIANSLDLMIGSALSVLELFMVIYLKQRRV